MRKIRKISAEEENFRLESMGVPGRIFIKRDPVEPEPVGTIVLKPMRVVGYDQDCDGSLMARLELIGLDEVDDLGEPDPEYRYADLDKVRTYADILTHIGLYETSGFVVTLDELRRMARETDESNGAREG